MLSNDQKSKYQSASLAKSELDSSDNNSSSDSNAVQSLSDNDSEAGYATCAIDHENININNIKCNELDFANATFILDSGATKHFINDKSLLSDIKSNKNVNVITANNQCVEFNESGTIDLNGINIKDAIYAPSFTSNLLSVSKLVDKGKTITFNKHNAIVTDNNGEQSITIPRINNLYVYDYNNDNNYNSCDLDQVHNINELLTQSTDSHESINNVDLWHYRLGHVGMSGLKSLIKLNAVNDIDINNSDVELHKSHICDGCSLGKAHRIAFDKRKNESYHATAIMDRVHADLCGPVIVQSIKGKYYVSTIIDEYSRKVSLKILNNKSDAINHIIEWINNAETFTGKRLKEFHSDKGGEYNSTKLLDYFKSKGIKSTSTCARTPQNNGIAERMNRTLFEMARSMLFHAGLSNHFWMYAIMTAAFIRNRCTSRSLQQIKCTPHEIWTGTKPSVKNMKVFGCDCYSHIHKEERGKMDHKSDKGIFIGYDEQRYGYKVYLVEQDKVITNRDVIFHENSFKHIELMNKLGLYLINTDINSVGDIKYIDVSLPERTDNLSGDINDINNGSNINNMIIADDYVSQWINHSTTNDCH
jgi:hypothetical protein